MAEPCAKKLSIGPDTPKPPTPKVGACVLPGGHVGRCVAIVVQIWSVEGPH